jgi:SNF family Na+-dependent transporter
MVSINKIEDAVPKKQETKEPVPEKEWSNPIEFLMTCIGFSVGLGNVWRFPYLCFKNGGSAFVIAMAILLFTIGLPLFFLEISIAQFSKFGPLEVWKMVPIFQVRRVNTISPQTSKPFPHKHSIKWLNVF